MPGILFFPEELSEAAADEQHCYATAINKKTGPKAR